MGQEVVGDIRVQRPKGAEWLGVWDLADDSGKTVDKTATIVKVTKEHLPGNGMIHPRDALVIWLRGTEKGLIVNKSIADTVAKLHGPIMGEWKGKKITLFATTCRVGKQDNVPCIRVRPTLPTAKPAPIESKPVDAEARAVQERAIAAAVAVGGSGEISVIFPVEAVEDEKAGT